MLKQIICDKFIQKKIVFHKGLNTVTGDDVATNSIGKSNMLMIIDFVFGGNDYITKNRDTVENLGDHEFKFSFEFDEEMFFIRNTKDYKFVYICNDKFEILKKITTNEYTELLKEKYRIEIEDISFREIVGRYSRVYGKENLNEKKPLQYYDKEKQKESIMALIKIFNKYGSIKNLEQQINTFAEEKNVLAKAAKNDFIPRITKTVFSKNEKSIEELQKEIDTLKNNIVSMSDDINVYITKDILELKREKSSIVKQINIYESRLKRTKKNISHEKPKLEEELIKLNEFFPNVNIEKINEVNTFHNSLANLLEKELKTSEKEIVDKIEVLNKELEEIDKKISDKLDIKDAPKYAVDRVVELATQIEQLTSENSYYNKTLAVTQNLKEAKEDLEQIKGDILSEVSNQINIKMNEINKKIYSDTRRAPTLNINGDRYTFNTYGDTGTGTAYANLITFDLSVLEMTKLPFLIHDLPLLKNIENNALENIVDLYNKFEKQIFIAIDKINTYNDRTMKIIYDNEVIKLSKDRTLFIKNWKKEN